MNTSLRAGSGCTLSTSTSCWSNTINHTKQPVQKIAKDFNIYTYRDFALFLLSPVPWAIQPPLLGCRPCCKKTHLCKCKVCSASGPEVLALQPKQTVRLWRNRWKPRTNEKTCGMHVITQAHPTCLGMRSSRGHVILVILWVSQEGMLTLVLGQQSTPIHGGPNFQIDPVVLQSNNTQSSCTSLRQ